MKRIVGWRLPIVALYAVLAVPAVYVVARIPTDNTIDRMIVESDPDFAATRAFEASFDEKPAVLLLAEAADPFAPEALRDLRALEAHLARTPGVRPVSALTIAERFRPRLFAPERREELKAFLDGTRFFREQGLVGEAFWGLALSLDAAAAKDQDRALAGIEQAILESGASARFSRIRRVGAAFVDSLLERETEAASRRSFPLFGVFVVALDLYLFRSWRTLLAILLTLTTCVLLGTAGGGLLGYSRTIVSSLVPLTLMVTATASLVYLQSRFVDCPPGRGAHEHQLFALADKFKPVTASILAAAAGFAALGLSRIRPVHEMGIWTAIGLLMTWVCCFTLFPALQRLLRTPTGRQGARAGALVAEAARRIPRWSHRWRWPLVGASLLLSAAGAVALLGLPGYLAPMPLETDTLDYLPPGGALVEDIRYFESHVASLQSYSLWVQGRPGTLLEPGFLASLDAFARALRADPQVGSVVGLTSILGLRRYAAGEPEALPTDERALARVAAELEQLLLQEPALREWVDLKSLGETRLVLLGKAGLAVGSEELGPVVQRRWAAAAAQHPALRGGRVRLVGRGLLSERIASHLVPTLVQSFLVTAAVIFIAFFMVFRSGAARLLAMIPSLFAILTMFLVMRVSGIPLNVATILIATTVLGASENDQIHFFWHFQEKRRAGNAEQALAHTVEVAGRAIFFATLVNAGGFLALALSDLPPMRQFGMLAASAFVLSMLADFTALPAALWILFGERPGAEPGLSAPPQAPA